MGNLSFCLICPCLLASHCYIIRNGHACAEDFDFQAAIAKFDKEKVANVSFSLEWLASMLNDLHWHARLFCSRWSHQFPTAQPQSQTRLKFERHTHRLV